MATGGSDNNEYIDLGANGTLNKELLMEKKAEQKMKILVIGQKGVGKTTLVRSFLAHDEQKGSKEEAKDVNNTSLKKDQSSCKNTMIEEVSSTMMCGNVLEFYDTVGLLAEKAQNKKMFQQISSSEMADGFNLVLVCIRMDQDIDKSLAQAMLEVSNIYGNGLWDCIIFVFTFANIYLQTLPPDNETETGDCMNHRIEILTDQLYKQLVQDPTLIYSVKEAVFQNIPTCVAGFGGRGNPSDLALPNTQDWVQDLLLACVSQSVDEPLVAAILDKDKQRMLIEAGGVGAGVVAGGTAGAFIGGAVGTLMFPVVGTVVGAGLGTLIGGGIGTVAGAGTVAVKRISDKHKEEDYNAADHIKERSREIFANVKTKFDKLKKPAV